jgi:hypothetical protein
MVGFGFAELLSAANNLVQQLKQAVLLINQELGVADNVDEEHISDLQLDLFLNFGHRLNQVYAFEQPAPDYCFGASELTICSKRPVVAAGVSPAASLSAVTGYLSAADTAASTVSGQEN